MMADISATSAADFDPAVEFDEGWVSTWWGPLRLGPLLLRWLCLWGGHDGTVRISRAKYG